MSAEVFFWLHDKDIGNFGDALTLMYRERLFGQRALFETGTLHLVGSVITEARLKTTNGSGFHKNDGKGRAIFWGCGKKNDVALPENLMRFAMFLGVRGTLSRDVLQLSRSNTPLGDTGLLLPAFYQPRHEPETSGKVLWVPHFHHDDPSPELLVASPDAVIRRPSIPNTVDACESFIDAIASARFVMANAMHAAIVALAYGVPFAFWRGSEINWPFKWADFTSGVGFQLPFCDSLAEGQALYDKIRPDRAFAEMDLQPLLDVAPYEVQDHIRYRKPSRPNRA